MGGCSFSNTCTKIKKKIGHAVRYKSSLFGVMRGNVNFAFDRKCRLFESD